MSSQDLHLLRYADRGSHPCHAAVMCSPSKFLGWRPIPMSGLPAGHKSVKAPEQAASQSYPSVASAAGLETASLLPGLSSELCRAKRPASAKNQACGCEAPMGFASLPRPYTSTAVTPLCDSPMLSRSENS